MLDSGIGREFPIESKPKIYFNCLCTCICVNCCENGGRVIVLLKFYWANHSLIIIRWANHSLIIIRVMCLYVSVYKTIGRLN